MPISIRVSHIFHPIKFKNKKYDTNEECGDVKKYSKNTKIIHRKEYKIVWIARIARLLINLNLLCCGKSLHCTLFLMDFYITDTLEKGSNCSEVKYCTKVTDEGNSRFQTSKKISLCSVSHYFAPSGIELHPSMNSEDTWLYLTCVKFSST